MPLHTLIHYFLRCSYKRRLRDAIALLREIILNVIKLGFNNLFREPVKKKIVENSQCGIFHIFFSFLTGSLSLNKINTLNFYMIIRSFLCWWRNCRWSTLMHPRATVVEGSRGGNPVWIWICCWHRHLNKIDWQKRWRFKYLSLTTVSSIECPRWQWPKAPSCAIAL